MSVNKLAEVTQVLNAYYGVPVTGGAKTLPATGTGGIFTVSGGRVIVTSLVGVVSTAIQNQACTLSVGNTPSGGSHATTSLCTATSIINLALNTSLAIPVAQASALIVGGASGVLPANGASSAAGVVFTAGGIAFVPVGTIDITTSATNNGAITWTVTYVPYDIGASVTAL